MEIIQIKTMLPIMCVVSDASTKEIVDVSVQTITTTVTKMRKATMGHITLVKSLILIGSSKNSTQTIVI